MKKYLLTLSCMLCFAAINAQVTTTISSGTDILNVGAMYNVPAGFFVNNGSYTDTTSPGAFNASGGVTFSGSGSTIVYNLHFMGGGSSLLTSTVTAYGTVTIDAGTTLDANNSLILHPGASLVVNGVLTNDAIGTVTNATATSGGCPSFTSSLSTNVSGSVILYQWESSPDSSTWTPVSGATNATYTATVTATTYYHSVITTTNSAYDQATAGVKLLFTGAPPTAITGTPVVCTGATTALSDAISAGTWTSSATGTATVDPVSGIVTGVSGGTATITYATGCGSAVTQTVTVNISPSAITGTMNVCAGLTTALTDAGGGTWSSSNTSFATIDPASGIVTGVATGVPTITYLISNGCIATAPVTVNPLPTSILGTATVCAGLTTTLTDAASGGAWTSSNTSAATVVSGTGVLTGVAAGTSTITYTLATGCLITTVVTVNPLPTAILGTNAVCVGLTTTLTDVATGGAWTSSNTSAATVVSGTGVVTGVAAGTSTITYTLGTGCLITAPVTVNPLPTAILGTATVCEGLTTTLTDATSGGAWTSGNTSAATVVSGTGIVTGVVAGTSTITYTLSTGCIASRIATVNPSPGAINGTNNVCVGLTTTLTDAVTGGAWSSSNTSVASVVSGTGVVTGSAAGTTTITYILPAGCNITMTLTVNPLPTSILGTATVCAGLTTTLTDATAGGAWTSGNTTAATVVSGTGVVTGVAAGTSTITYTLGTGCIASRTATVNPSPVTISGANNVCIGLTTTLTDAVTGGAWSSSNTTVASVVSGTGVVTGSVAGTTTITYTLPAGCNITMSLTVNPLPTSILGTATVCAGLTTTLTDATAGGAWTSGNTTAATVVSGTGVVTGVAGGTSTITYTLGTGCLITTVATVNPVPGTITGTTNVCIGLTAALTDATSGGVWSSSNTAQATVASGTGVVTGVAAGTPTITYLLPTGCLAITTVTVNTAPPAITGTGAVCVGLTTTLTDAIGGGTWSSSNTGLATIGPSTGIVTGVAGGAPTITYILTGGCTGTTVVTVNPLPVAISGASSVCLGLTTTLTDASGFGAWSSSNTSIASIGSSTGIVTGAGTGSATITYTLSTGCTITTPVTVNALPTSILGTMSVCAGLTTTLTDAAGGGAWTSGNISAATIVSGTGVVTGVAAGTSTITYTLGTGCTITAVVTVNPLPLSITGTTSVCAGLTTNLTDASTGGAWTSGTTAASVSGTGVVTGLTVGTSTITYTLPTTCLITTTVTVNPLPTAVLGTNNVCAGLTTTLTDATGGGSWTSSNVTLATVGSSTGVVTGVAAGTPTLTYALTATGCIATTTVTVNPLPSAITGTMSVCKGLTTTLTDATAGGAWTSGTTAVATVAAGVVSGVTAGTATITYTLPTGCIVTAIVTVNPLPAAITGTQTVCVNAATTLSDVTLFGDWSSGTTANATINIVSGVATGVAAGTSTITYSLSTGCISTAVVTVNPIPAAITAVTVSNVCVGSTVGFNDASGFGNWSSSNTTIAAIGTGTGIVTGVSTGTPNITYTFASGCFVTAPVTVNPLPSAISGTPSACIGSGSTLTDGGGGTWSSSLTTVASINSVTGVVAALTAGTTTITYTLPTTGCTATTAYTVNPFPSAITGTAAVCVAGTTTLTDASPFGAWSSTATTVAVGSGTGIVSGVAAGTATVTYTLATGCTTTTAVTVNPLPAAILGASTVCVGLTTTLTDATSGGNWTSSNISLATINISTGLVTGISSGTPVMDYTLPTGCSTTAIMTVNALPAGITGTTSVCTGLTTPLSDATSGGAWSSSNTAASVSGSGVVTGVTAGTATITYTLPTGCISTVLVTVNPLPAAISGTATVCPGTTTTLTDATGFGNWTSSNPSSATIVSGTGVATGIIAGTVTITYSLGTGCINTTTLTINPLPLAITGTPAVCTGLTTTLTDATAGGAWTSSNTGVATVAAGLVSGIAAGPATISYTLPTGCMATQAVTVNPLPSAITGTTNVCIGNTTTLADPTAFGAWSSSNTTITIGSGTGIVTGVAVGPATVTYTLGTGCTITTAVTVNPFPSAITGTTNVCPGLTTTLTDAGGGNWSSSNTTLATVAVGTGVVTGVSTGTLTITYTLGTGCTATTAFTVNPLPATIAGTPVVCAGLTTTLTDATAGGAWSSSNTAVATVTGGVVTGLGTVTVTSTATITYTLPTGCINTTVVTVNPTPVAITGTTNVCAGLTTSLADLTLFGAWSSSNTTIATVASGTGVVSGLTAGTTTITYALLTGCNTTTPVTVNPLPVAISGPAVVCAGLTTTLTDASAGGTWTSTTTSVATIVSGSGLVTGVSAGTSTITYTLATGCIITRAVTVNPLPLAITGTTNVCIGLTTTLSDATIGGTWTSSDGTLAPIGASTGIVTGLNAGVPTITYTLGTGCIMTTPVTVNPLPPAITGTNNVCAGLTTTLTDATAGGAWSSSNTAVATVAGGVVSGLGTVTVVSTATITYTLPTGCINTTVVTVNPLPLAITGITNVCPGATTALADVTPLGVWSSGNTTITVASGTGVVSGVAAGTATVTYTLGTGCLITTPVTVNPLPTAILGTAAVCAGLTTTLTDAGGGTWTSSNTTVATVVAGTGVVTGLVSGNSTITYTLSTGCTATRSVTVNPLPLAITGSPVVCAGLTTALTDATAGGNWSSSNTTVSISASGVVTGLVAGGSTVTYTLPSTGCIMTMPFTVNPLPTAILGTPVVCVGLTTALTDATAGGAWTTSNTATDISVTGVVTGLAAGVSTITYTLPTSCIMTQAVLVNPLPASITGTAVVCAGLTTTLTDATAGGGWSSSNTAVATVAGGVVSGVAAGTATVTYTLPTGCINTTIVTVNPLPSAIAGLNNVCFGLTTVLTDPTPFGDWSSSNTAVATIGSATGLVNGLTAGPTTITYTLATGCISTLAFTVNPLPAAILGNAAVCAGLTTTLTDAGGGTWTSSNTSVGTIVTGTGVLSGILAGNTIITYTLPTGCIITRTATVNPLPAVITGTPVVCAGLTTTLSDITIPGVWSSSNTALATVAAGTGVVTGVSAGTPTITYTIPTGCIMTQTVLVNPLPTAILGTPVVCAGLTTTLSDATALGVWSSGNTAVATIGSGTGVVSGIAAGTTTITYTLPTGCIMTQIATVNPLPTAILGTPVVCAGLTTTLSDASVPGAWSSSNTAAATIDAGTGVLSGVAAGTTTITYTLPTGCILSEIATVNPLPASITGTAVVCAGLTTALSDVTASGVWSSGNTSIATVAAGVVTGISAGTTTITYTLPTGCLMSDVVTVNPLPLAITGTMNVCAGLTTALTDATTLGVWSSSNTAAATIDAASGIVSGIAAGTTTITYTLPTGCIMTSVVTVNPLPAAITGHVYVCTGLSITLSDATAGGAWSSSNTALATVVAGTGVITGVAAGDPTITYMLPTGCIMTQTVDVSATPVAISGTLNVCAGLTTTLSDATVGGTWSSSNTTVATIDMATGLATGVSAGAVTMTYTFYSLPTGCTTTSLFTVNPLPAAITGTMNVCAGLTTTLSDAGGGTWSSSDPVIGVDTTTGVITGITAGTGTVTYTLPTGCITTTTITTNPLPAAITGTMSVCVGLTTTLSDTTVGGTWSSSDVTLATVDSSTGIVTGVAAGVPTLTYTLSTGCIMTTSVTVNGLPDAISGNNAVCPGLTTTLTDTTAGGAWTSGNTAVATIDATLGTVNGMTAGTSTITYTVPTGCTITKVMTVNPLPLAITGTMNVCAGLTTALTDVGGGTWTSGNTAVATVVSGTGVVTGVTASTAAITYTLPTGCIISTAVTVNALPTMYTVKGGGAYCAGGTGELVTLSGSDTGFTYQLYKGAFATGAPEAGTDTALTFGPDTAAGTYTVVSTNNTTGCNVNMASHATISINALPLVYNVTGGGSYCAGGTGVAVGIDSTEPGINYLLFRGGTIVDTPLSGTGHPIMYGAQTTAGTYTIIATNVITGCSNNMADSAVIMITPLVTPSVSFYSGDQDTICVGSLVTFTAIPVNGGTSPMYQWSVNGVNTGLNNPVFSYVPADGDVVVALLTSNAACVSPVSASNEVTVNTEVVYVPAVTITANPGTVINKGQSVTLQAVVTNGGPAPMYQWYKGTTAIAGATTDIYTSSKFANKDSITCVVTGSGKCGHETFTSVIMQVNSEGITQVTQSNMDVRVVPNPNNGTFTISGSLGTTDDEEVSLEITDMIGQVIYHSKVMAHEGNISEQVHMDRSVANGMYLLNVNSATGGKVFHVVIEQ